MSLVLNNRALDNMLKIQLLQILPETFFVFVLHDFDIQITECLIVIIIPSHNKVVEGI